MNINLWFYVNYIITKFVSLHDTNKKEKGGIFVMDVIYAALFHIDHTREEPVEVIIARTNADLGDYINDLVTQITTADVKRKFNFPQEVTAIRSVIERLIKADYHAAAVIAATRLLRVEKNIQERMEHLIEIQKGSLFIAFVNDDEIKKIVISKAEHSPYIDEDDLRKHEGLPIKRKTFKALLVELDNNSNISNTYVYDTNSVMAKYWWQEYLELVELYTDEYNTRTAFNSIDKIVLSKIKSTSPADYTIIRNSTVGFFRANQNFSMDTYIQNILMDYQPVDPDLSTDTLITKIRELPEINGFDNSFRIITDELNARMIRDVVKLSDKLDLILKDNIENMNDEIKSVKRARIKYIMIRSDEGYDRFKTE